MIQIKDLVFSYNNKSFIEISELTFRDNELTVIIGENGSGKTTLLNLIAGEAKSQQGNVLVDGENIVGLKKRELAKRLSYFPQGRVIPDITVYDAILLGRYPYRGEAPGYSKEDIEIAKNAMEETDTAKFRERILKKLSYGERQRVYLAMQISQGSQNRIYDEPTNFMDVSSKFQILDHLVNSAVKGICVVCVLHDISLAMSYANRIIVLKNGKVYAEGTPDVLYKNRSIDKAFGIKIERIRIENRDVYVVLP